LHETDIAPSAVVFDHVSFAFDDHVVLRNVSFDLPKGSMKMLLGASGAGKSVVLKLILGLLRPDAGAIFVGGRRIDRMTVIADGGRFDRGQDRACRLRPDSRGTTL